MQMTNNRGKETGKIIYKITNVTGNGASSTVNQQVFDAKGKSVTTSTNKIKCSNGVMMMDIKSFYNPAPGQQQQLNVRGEEVYIQYPSNMLVGATLPDGTASFTTSGGAVNGEMEMSMTNRKVEAQENITTPAGTWNCFKISYKMEIKTKVAGISIPMRFEMTEWFAPNFGIVKSTSKYGDTQIVSIE